MNYVENMGERNRQEFESELWELASLPLLTYLEHSVYNEGLHLAKDMLQYPKYCIGKHKLCQRKPSRVHLKSV